MRGHENLGKRVYGGNFLWLLRNGKYQRHLSLEAGYGRRWTAADSSENNGQRTTRKRFANHALPDANWRRIRLIGGRGRGSLGGSCRRGMGMWPELRHSSVETGVQVGSQHRRCSEWLMRLGVDRRGDGNASHDRGPRDLTVTWVSLDTRVTAATQRRKSWAAAQREMLV